MFKFNFKNYLGNLLYQKPMTFFSLCTFPRFYTHSHITHSSVLARAFLACGGRGYLCALATPSCCVCTTEKSCTACRACGVHPSF